MNSNGSTLTERIQTLSADQIVEVEDFVEFVRLRGKERGLARAATAARRPALEAVWNNPEDEANDAL